MSSENPFGLGLVAEYKRKLRSGDQFTKFIAECDGGKNFIKRNGNVLDTVNGMAKTAEDYKGDVSQLADVLKKTTVPATLEAIWNFVFHHIQYTLDDPGEEQLRRPARTWKDRVKGVDCDCYSIFISALLRNLKIPHSFRITKYNGDWQHVYVVAHHNGQDFLLDCVLDKFNTEKPFSAKRDFQMTNMNGLGLPIAQLTGFGDTNNDSELIEISTGADFQGLGDSAENSAELNQYHQQMKQHIEKTAAYIRKNPNALATQGINPETYLKMLDYALENWDTPNRQNALDILAKNEAEWNLQTEVSGLSGNDDSEDESDDAADRFQIDSLSGINGLGNILDADPADFEKEWANTVSGLGKAKKKKGKKNFFQRMANAHKAFRKKHGKAGKKILSFMVSGNPLTLFAKKKFGRKKVRDARNKRLAPKALPTAKAGTGITKRLHGVDRALPAHMNHKCGYVNRATLYGFGDMDELSVILSDSNVAGLGNTGNEEADQEQYYAAILQKIMQTRDYISRNPASIASQGLKPDTYIKMLDYAIDNWNTPKRQEALDTLAKEEDRWNVSLEMSGLGNVDDFQEDVYQYELDTVAGVKGFGNILDVDPEDFDAAYNRLVSGLGIGDLGKPKKKKKPGFFKRIANGVKAIGKKIGKAAKKVIQVINRINPLFMVVRGGTILAMKLNLFNMAARLLPGLYSLEEARKHNVSESVWKASKTAGEKVKKFWENFGGKWDNLVKGIKHKADKKKWKKAAGLKGFGCADDVDFQGLGEPVTIATVISAATALVTIIATIGKAFKGAKPDPKAVQAAEAEQVALEGLGLGDASALENDQIDTFSEAGEGEQKKNSGWVKKFVDLLKKIFKGNPKKKAARAAKKAQKKAAKAAKTKNPKQKAKLEKDAAKLKEKAKKLNDEAEGKLSATQIKAQKAQAAAAPGSPEYLNAATAELTASEAANTEDLNDASEGNTGLTKKADVTDTDGDGTQQAGFGMGGMLLMGGALVGGLLLMGGKGGSSSRARSTPGISGPGKKKKTTNRKQGEKVSAVLLR